MLGEIRRFFHRVRERLARPMPTGRVVVDDVEIVRFAADGQVERMPWANLAEVRIVTTSGGPFVEDVFWVLTGRDGTCCVVPSPEDRELFPRLQILEGFDHNAVSHAMSCTDDAEFLCWTALENVAIAPSPSTNPPEGPIDGQDSPSL